MTEIRSRTIDEVQSACAPLRGPLWLAPWSLEATAPTAADIAALAPLVPPGTDVLLSALPRIPHDEQIAAARLVRAAGLEPVLHLSARKFASEAELGHLLETACRDIGLRKVLVIAGDIDAARGPFASSLDLIESAPFRAAPLQSVGIGGYPEGHPFVADADLERSLRSRLDAIRDAGRAPFLVSQFCFDAERILRWLDGLRRLEPALPVRIGLAGPASAATLMKVALRCWVDLPMRHARTATRLLSSGTPDPIVAGLDAGLRPHHRSGPLQIHVYGFGGLVKAAAWAGEAARTARAGWTA
ncbi:MetFprotein-like protein [Polymorphum gilvum SL003B-26A1]|uniref:Methylenetetrahydrofolate reductase n=1 Tax=Polymorphum gilvum (strain LMG 25793 / CGMCC 1.9160 / SL003B-26A1) TaxID=991905 RepID=F2J4F2_POLGS|nr:MetFprotein-like protein [Polymorphum gilvum SL003B-26A1]